MNWSQQHSKRTVASLRASGLRKPFAIVRVTNGGAEWSVGQIVSTYDILSLARAVIATQDQRGTYALVRLTFDVRKGLFVNYPRERVNMVVVDGRVTLDVEG